MPPAKSRRTASRRSDAAAASASGSASGSGSHAQTHASGSSSAAAALDAPSYAPRRLLEHGSARVPVFGDVPGGTGWEQADETEQAQGTATATGDGDGDDGEWGVWEYEEHEHVVLLDLGPAVEKLVKASAEYSISGLETDTPFLRIGRSTFAGAWDEALGSEIVLYDTQSAPHPSSDPLLPLAPTPSDAAFARAPSTSAARIRFLPLRPPPQEKAPKPKKKLGRPILTVEQRAQRALERVLQGNVPKRLTKEEREERTRQQRERREAARARKEQDAQSSSDSDGGESESDDSDDSDDTDSSEEAERATEMDRAERDGQSEQETE